VFVSIKYGALNWDGDVDYVGLAIERVIVICEEAKECPLKINKLLSFN
jgi:hypothetical protein